jgi:hypothetical protein
MALPKPHVSPGEFHPMRPRAAFGRACEAIAFFASEILLNDPSDEAETTPHRAASNPKQGDCGSDFMYK